MHPPADRLLLYCRPGFEPECQEELADHAHALGVAGQFQSHDGWLTFIPLEREEAHRLARELPWPGLTFARQVVVVSPLLENLPREDRLTPILRALSHLPGPFADIWVETPDTNDGKELLALGRRLDGRLREGMNNAGLLAPGDATPHRAHLFLLDGGLAHVGYSLVGNASPWPMGIPRLRVGPDAPSRSALKLEEAFIHFLTPRERQARLRAGLSAVDLGAAPGGWSWILMQRGIKVTAVDNGPMNEALLASPLLRHLREDGFHYAPPKPVNWLVCDIVDQPEKVTRLVARWASEGWCREAIFNLKLPMRKRRPELIRRQAQVEEALRRASHPFQLRFKQLYHDRQEVTGHLRVM